MRCLSCHYDLRHRKSGPENRCPECGRAFDPRDARTYQLGPTLRQWLLMLLIVYVSVMTLMFSVMFLFNR